MRARLFTTPIVPLLCAVVGCAGAPRATTALLSPEAAPPTTTRPRARSLGRTFGPITPRAIAQATEGHGAWIESSSYGPVWLPAQPVGFSPYVSQGRWLVTDIGWYWQSDLPWGDLAFHYGRWIPWGARWAWVPGTQFAPAWVDWRVGNGWVAWAPSAPRFASAQSPLVFCPAREALGRELQRVIVTGAAASSLYPQTRAVEASVGHGGAVYARGPGDEVPDAARVALAAIPEPTIVAQLRAVVSLDAHERRVAPPVEVDEVPAAQGLVRVPRDARGVDLRAPVRIRAPDLERVTDARISVINLPPGARAAMFERRRVAQAPSEPPQAEPRRDERPPSLPPPADLPLTWWRGGAPRARARAPQGVAVGASFAPPPPRGSTAPLIGMSGPPPSTGGAVVSIGGVVGRGVSVPSSSTGYAAQPALRAR